MARPRSFDTDAALTAATKIFLAHGFDGASLDDLTRAMGIAKPSLYAAFGDKSSLYVTVLQGYAEMAKTGMRAALDQGNTLEEASRHLLISAIEVYAPRGGEQRGCLVATTATTVAATKPNVRELLARFLDEIDRLLVETIKSRFGHVLSDESVAVVGQILSATMYSLAIRARAGVSRRQLGKVVDKTIEAINHIKTL